MHRDPGFQNLTKFFFFLLILENCKELKRTDSHEVTHLKPYTYYGVSLHAYVDGRVRRNGSAERCFFQTKAARKCFAIMCLP